MVPFITDVQSKEEGGGADIIRTYVRGRWVDETGVFVEFRMVNSPDFF